jgi:biotin carboxyl carrier protein
MIFMIEIKAHLTGNLWKVLVTPGQEVAQGETLVIMESMKMEIVIESPCAAKVSRIAAKEGTQIKEGTLILVLQSL